MPREYIAVTIGPILRTMNLTTSPGALWASSYLFSWVAREIRKALIEEKLAGEEQFITPYSADRSHLERNDGLGLLHDRMIFEKTDAFTFEKFRAIRDKVLKGADEAFAIHNPDFLRKYIMVSAVSFRAENPVLGCGKILDCMELAVPFVPREERNPLLDFFTNGGSDEGRNQAIKKQGTEVLGIDPEKWQLLRPAGSAADAEDRCARYNVLDLPAIARGGTAGSGLKKHLYYAAVRSDGDNMGKLIESLQIRQGEDPYAEYHAFSQACLAYCERVALLVREYLGMTVYAGGDDLLALLPCENRNGKTVFHFVREANRIFREIFVDRGGFHLKADALPSLTWGITICHCKYPLNEALEDSAALLFGAKGRGGSYKNAVNLRLIKHSGQAGAVILSNGVLESDAFSGLLEKVAGMARKDGGSADEILLSCLHAIGEFRVLFSQAGRENIQDLFTNMFDADAHEGSVFLHEDLPDFCGEYCMSGMICALDENGDRVAPDKPDHAAAMEALLRVLKFLTEKAGERE